MGKYGPPCNGWLLCKLLDSLAALLLFALGAQDIIQTHYAVRRNYPLSGRPRYALESIRGMLPATKVSAENCAGSRHTNGPSLYSPASHSAFITPLDLIIGFIASLRELSKGKPIGIKMCIGQVQEWFGVVKATLNKNVTPDFIVIDGAAGGTGAAPIEFADHMGMSMRDGLRLVHNALVGAGLRSKIKLGASGKILYTFDIARCIALGADWCNPARGFMFTIGCIQSRNCHTDACPLVWQLRTWCANTL
jgi:glutamate synthase domain-containing protein 2